MPTDAELVRRVAAGDSDAFGQLYAGHARGIYLLARQLLGSDAANDLVQDVFMSVWQKAHQYDEGRGTFRTWLNAIARHRILDLARHRPREQHDRAAQTLAEEIDEVVAGWTDVAEQATVRAESARVLGALNTLPPAQRQALLYVYFGGYTHHELATLLGWPLGTVKKRVRLGLAKLAVQLGHLRPEALVAAEEMNDEL